MKLDTEKVIEKYKDPVKKQFSKLELIDKMQALENELEEMKHALKEDIRMQSTADEDMAKLNNRVNDLRKQIVQIMNKGDENKWKRNITMTHLLETKI